jgi:hypothetical protein
MPVLDAGAGTIAMPATVAKLLGASGATPVVALPLKSAIGTRCGTVAPTSLE